MKLKKFTIVSNLTVIALLGIGYLVATPLLNPLFAQGTFIWLVVLSLFVVVNSPTALAGISLQQSSSGQIHFHVDGKVKGFKKLVKILVIFWGGFALVILLSSPLFRASAYRDQLGTPMVSDFSEDIQLVDLAQVPIVDRALAYNLADKKLGENPGMGSQVYLGEPVIQQVDGNLVWVVPLLHSGFFKWLKNIEGSAGYIKVSATNLQDITFVESPIKYQPDSFFFDDITRYLRTVKGKAFTPLTDYSFEIDDNGTPYWIITVYENRWLFALPEATGVLLLHAETGELEEYDIEDVPYWVDRVQPEEFILQQVNHQGLYVHGIFNFSNLDKFMTSGQEAIIYNEGSCYLFTGLTSVGSDESAIGFIMVDMVTKESKIYQISGATERKAMESAQGEVQQYGYTATSPIIINHRGIPTYFITLKDQGGLIKRYAFVSVSDVTSVGAGETISAAQRDYNTTLTATNTFVAEEGEEKWVISTVERIAWEDDTQGLQYKIILSDLSHHIFLLSPELSHELALTQSGDLVEVHYYESETGVVNASAFDNLELEQRP